MMVKAWHCNFLFSNNYILHSNCNLYACLESGITPFVHHDSSRCLGYPFLIRFWEEYCCETWLTWTFRSVIPAWSTEYKYRRYQCRKVYEIFLIMILLESLRHRKRLPRCRISLWSTIMHWILVPLKFLCCGLVHVNTGHLRSTIQLDNMDEFVQHFLSSLKAVALLPPDHAVLHLGSPSLCYWCPEGHSRWPTTDCECHTVHDQEERRWAPDSEAWDERSAIAQRWTRAAQSECSASQRTHLAPQMTCCSTCATKPWSYGLRSQ